MVIILQFGKMGVLYEAIYITFIWLSMSINTILFVLRLGDTIFLSLFYFQFCFSDPPCVSIVNGLSAPVVKTELNHTTGREPVY